MEIEFDEAKRSAVLGDRALDLSRSAELFEKFHLTRRDDKHSADEERFQSVGLIDDEVVIVVWTLRNTARRIVTMWKCNEQERKNYYARRERDG